MWPQTLQMSREECRGVLRRLELESYSHVISVFRAQGGLNEPKTKLLEELRNMFHISQDRHRAEARRVANDEQLCTIAEVISGPNTWQDWSREGRRMYPLLPRVDPQTALTIIANDIAMKAKTENDKLLLPMETASVAEEVEISYIAARNVNKMEPKASIVFDEPFKMPDVPSEVKQRNMKRNNTDETKMSSKKRHTQHQQDLLRQTVHVTSNSGIDVMPHASAIGKLYNSYNRQIDAKILAQQRFFHQQYIKHKQKMSNKKSSAATSHFQTQKQGSTKRHGAKNSNKRSKKLQQKQHHQKQLQEQLQKQQLKEPLEKLELLKTTTPHNNITMMVDNSKLNHNDISNNGLNDSVKLQLVKKHEVQLSYAPLSPPSPPPQTAITNLSAISPTRFGTNSPNFKEKQANLLTPVKKYIADERQAAAQPITTAQTPIVVSPTSSVQPGSTSPTQDPANNPSKARSNNSAILSGNTKLATPKKLHPAILDQTTLLEGTTLATNTAQLSLSPTTTPIAAAPTPVAGVSPATLNKSKPIITSVTRLLPFDPTVQHPGIQHGTLKDKSTMATSVQKYIVEDRQPATTMSATFTLTTNTTPSVVALGATSPTVNVIKNIPANSLNNSLITPLTATTQNTVFRKSSANIIKATTNTGGGPQIISNIKLTQATPIKQLPPGAICKNVKICHSSNGKMYLQPAHLSDATKVKLQTSLVNATHKFNMATSLSGTTLTGTTLSTTAASSSGQRISIQKVQIISGPMISSANVVNSSGAKTTSFSFTGGNKSNMIFLPAAAASNMRPITLAKGTTIGSIISKGATTTGAVTGAGVASVTSTVTATATTIENSKSTAPNLVVIGPTTGASTGSATGTSSLSGTTAAIATATKPTKLANITTSKAMPATISATKLDKSQYITEDTPVDILNMPIIVDDSQKLVLSPTTDNKDANMQGKQHQKQNPNQQMVLIDATDWEMELDQAKKDDGSPTTATATPAVSTASTTGTTTAKRTVENKRKQNFSNDLMIDDSFDDVIEEEIIVTGDASEKHTRTKTQRHQEQQKPQQKQTQSCPSMCKVVEIDENTALEYMDLDLDEPIQQQQSSTRSNAKTTPTFKAPAIIAAAAAQIFEDAATKRIENIMGQQIITTANEEALAQGTIEQI